MAHKSVVVVEDEENIAASLTFILKRAGFAVTLVNDGARATAAVGQNRPDAVVLDVMLPNRSGLDICRDLKGNPATAAIPVLMLSAKSQDKDRTAATAAGADHYMTKPFANADVVATLESLIA